MSAPAIYTGTVRHRRRDASGREFSPKLFLAYLDVDSLPGSLDPIPLWSARHPAPVRYRRRDFLDGGDGPLGEAVRDLVAERIGRRPSGSIDLLAHLRTFGWLHNPLGVYYCWSDDGRDLDALVLEVTNTPWGERHCYVFDARVNRGRATIAKAMYVSPFLPMDARYRVSWTPPGAELVLRVGVEQAGRLIFDTELALRREPLDRARALGIFVRYPMMTLRVSAAIYRQGARLFLSRVFLARVPLYRHKRSTEAPGRSELDRKCAHG